MHFRLLSLNDLIQTLVRNQKHISFRALNLARDSPSL